MLITAWEDPESKDATLDVVQDEQNVTIDEKLSEVKESLNDFKD